MSLSPITCPAAWWVRVRNNLSTAVLVSVAMKGAPAQADRDRATKAYVAAVDALVEDLSAMAEDGLLDDIGGYLDTLYGRV